MEPHADLSQCGVVDNGSIAREKKGPGPHHC